MDIYYLLKIMRMDKMLALTEKKYEVFNKYQGLRALTYFEDAEEDAGRRRLGSFEKVEWVNIKQEIIAAVNKYTREHLPKK